MNIQDELKQLKDKIRDAIDDGDYGRSALIDFMEEDAGTLEALIEKLDGYVVINKDVIKNQGYWSIEKNEFIHDSNGGLIQVDEILKLIESKGDKQ